MKNPVSLHKMKLLDSTTVTTAVFWYDECPYDSRRDERAIRQQIAYLVVFLMVGNTNNEISYYITIYIE